MPPTTERAGDPSTHCGNTARVRPGSLPNQRGTASSCVVIEAAMWGFVAGTSLLIGALIGLFIPVPTRVVGLVMGFGVGVLISAVAFELTESAYDRAGAVPVVLGLSAGALVFFMGDLMIARRGGRRRKDPTGTTAAPDASGASALVLGALLTASLNRRPLE